jgi:predicted DNA-binding ribbon-helix-helix protein
MSGGIVKRSVAIARHRTSVSLEEPFWDALRAIASERALSVQALIGLIDAGRGDQNLSSAIRVFVLHAMQGRAIPPVAPEPEAQAECRSAQEAAESSKA